VISENAIVGVILAGGKSSRMGTDKSLLPIGGEPMFQRVATRLGRQVGRIVVSANQDPEPFRAAGLPVVADSFVDRGPLAGFLAGMIWASAVPDATHILTVACDTPFFPIDLAERLSASLVLDRAGMAIARSAGRDHYVFSLQPIALADELERWIVADADRSLKGWMLKHSVHVVDFDLDADPFFNINRPEDMRVARDRVTAEDKVSYLSGRRRREDRNSYGFRPREPR